MEHYSGCLTRSSGACPFVLARGHVGERSKLDIWTRPDVSNMYHKVGPSACHHVCTQTKVSSDKFLLTTGGAHLVQTTGGVHLTCMLATVRLAAPVPDHLSRRP